MTPKVEINPQSATKKKATSDKYDFFDENFEFAVLVVEQNIAEMSKIVFRKIPSMPTAAPNAEKPKHQNVFFDIMIYDRN